MSRALQGSLFELQREAPRFPTGVNEAALRGLAFLYTATAAGTATGIKFMATIEHAQLWCETPISKGRHYDTEWAYFWTSTWHFINNYSGEREAYGGPLVYTLDLSRCEDNGEWDERIASTGCHKISLPDIPGILQPLGVCVIPPEGHASHVNATRQPPSRPLSAVRSQA